MKRQTKMSEFNLNEYLFVVKQAVDEWNLHFKNYDINDYLYEDQEAIVYGIMEKFYSRIRLYQRRIPKQWKIKGLPTLRGLVNDYMYEDSDFHLSDYEAAILVPMEDLLKNQDI